MPIIANFLIFYDGCPCINAKINLNNVIDIQYRDE